MEIYYRHLTEGKIGICYNTIGIYCRHKLGEYRPKEKKGYVIGIYTTDLLQVYLIRIYYRDRLCGYVIAVQG